MLLRSRIVNTTTLSRIACKALRIEIVGILEHILPHRKWRKIAKFGTTSTRSAGEIHSNNGPETRQKGKAKMKMIRDLDDRYKGFPQDNSGDGFYNKSLRSSNLTGISLNYRRIYQKYRKNIRRNRPHVMLHDNIPNCR